MTQIWTIYTTATNAVLSANFETPSPDIHPKDFGWAWDLETQSARRIDGIADEHVARWNGSDWEPDLFKLRALKSAEVNERRAEAESAGCNTPFGVVDSDERSQIKFAGSVMRAMIAQARGEIFIESWTMRDNSQVDLDADDMIAMGLAVGAYVSAVHAHGVELKAAIEDPTTDSVAAIDAIDITSGWPT